MLKKMMKKVAVLMCGTMVALSCVGLTSAFAHESNQGTLTVTYQYGGQSARGRNFRDTFNAASSSNQDSFAIISMKESSGNYTASYCMDYNKVCYKGDTVTAGYSDITNEEQVLLNHALLNGFSKEYSSPKEISTEDANLYYATQCLVWVITEGQFYNDTERAKLEERFGVNNNTFKSTYENLYKKVAEQVELPKFASTKKSGSSAIKLSWNSSSNAYEAELSDIGVLANAKCSNLPEGVTVSVNNGKMNIKSTKELTNEIIKLTVESTTKGGVKCWGNTASNHQPQATIDSSDKVVDYDSYVNISTDKKPEEAKPADNNNVIITPAPKPEKQVEDNDTPKQDTPVATEKAPVVTEEAATENITNPTEAPVQTETPAEDNGNVPIPKTGDNSPVKIIIIVLGVALVGGIAFGVKTFLNKRS